MSYAKNRNDCFWPTVAAFEVKLPGLYDRPPLSTSKWKIVVQIIKKNLSRLDYPHNVGTIKGWEFKKMPFRLNLLYLILLCFSSPAIKAETDWSWCYEGKHKLYGLEDVNLMKENSVPLQEGYDQYRASNYFDAVMSLRSHALMGVVDAQKSLGKGYLYLSEESNPFGELRARQCQEILKDSAFKEAFEYFLQDDNQGDKKAIEIFLTMANKDETGVSSFYLRRILISIGSHRDNSHYDPVVGAKYLEEAMDLGIGDAKKFISQMGPFGMINRGCFEQEPENPFLLSASEVTP